VLDGDPALPKKRRHNRPQFSANVLWPNGRMDQHVTWCGDRPHPGHIVLDGDPSPKKGHSSPMFRPMSIVAKRLDGSRCHLVPTRCKPRPWPLCVTWGPSSHQKRGLAASDFSAHVLWPNGCMDQDVTWYGLRPRPRRHSVRRGPSCTPPQKGCNFSANELWPNGRMDQHASWYGDRTRPDRIVLHGYPGPPKRGIAAQPPRFSPCLLWPNGWMNQGATWYRDRPRPGHIFLDGDPAPPRTGTAAPIFLPMSVVAKRLDGSRCHLVWWQTLALGTQLPSQQELSSS